MYVAEAVVPVLPAVVLIVVPSSLSSSSAAAVAAAATAIALIVVMKTNKTELISQSDCNILQRLQR